MKLGATIAQLRKQHQLSQEDFAEQFNVTRQTVSNWEHEKSSPDLETLLKISETFDISVDELLNNSSASEEKKTVSKKTKTLTVLISLVLTILILLGLFVNYRRLTTEKNIIYQLDDDKTITLKEKLPSVLEINEGAFNLSKDSTLNLQASGEIDDGAISIVITANKDHQIVYQQDSDNFKDNQQLSLAAGTYNIQINAHDFKEQVLSLTYHLQLSLP